MGQGGLCQDLQGLVVVHLMVVEDAAVAVVGVLAHAHIGDDIAVGVGGLNGPDALLHHAVGVPGGGTAGVLVGRDAEQQHPADAGIHTSGDLLTDPVGRITELAVQGGDGLLDVFSLHHKQRIDQTVRGHSGLPHHTAQGVAAAKSAGTNG